MRRIMLGVTGGIAAYKIGSLITGLRKAGHEVNVVMTEAATHFITPLTLESLSAKPVYTDMFAPSGQYAVEHIGLAQWADLFVVAPCTANVIGKLAHGIADDFLTTIALAVTCPVVLCPAMNHHMYNHPAVQENLELLRRRGCHIIEPEAGRLASGAYGKGRLPEPEAILERIASTVPGWEDYLHENIGESAVAGPGAPGVQEGLLAGLGVLVTAGPTREFLDPARFLSNPSSGRMGYELARAAREAGADVVLVSGPTELDPPEGVEVVPVISAADMAREVLARYDDVDVVFKAAAVADYAPAVRHDNKLKKEASPDEFVLKLKRTADILKELGSRKEHQVLVGFAAESDEPIENGRRKLREKNLDLVVVNDITRAGSGFAVDTNEVTILGPGDEVETLPLISKREVARHLVGRAAELVG